MRLFCRHLTNLKSTIIILVLFIASITKGSAQVDSLPIRLAGIIYSNDTSASTPFVHIINYRTGKGVISDSTGFFKTTLKKNDSLLFSCMGYEDKIFILPDTIVSTILLIEVRLSKKTYYLDVIDVLALSRINQFSYDFKNIPLQENRWKQQIIIPGVTKENYVWLYQDERFIPKQTFGGPITAIYKLFSDREASIRKYLELINSEEGNLLIDEKYNMEMLSEYTGFTGDTLIDFKLYLNFSRSYLLTTDGYHIFKKIDVMLPDFKETYFSDIKEE